MSSRPGKTTLNKIRKLAKSRGYDLLSVRTGKRIIAFTYRDGERVFSRYYPSVLKGLEKELAMFSEKGRAPTFRMANG